MAIKTYTELIALPTFKERFDYLNVEGQVGEATFGFERYLNQNFYKSDEWKAVRNAVISRDNGCDLGLSDEEIRGRIIVHHMNPITTDDIINRSDFLLNPEYLICVSHNTHEALHYGTYDLIEEKELVVRKPNDTCPWR